MMKQLILGLTVCLSPVFAQTNWTNVFPNFNAVAHGKGVYVAVGPAIMVSRDKEEWRQVHWTRWEFLDVIFARDMFVAVGFNQILISDDGFSWNEPVPGLEGNIRGVAYGNRRFVAIGGRGWNPVESILLSSEDGIHWAARDSGVQEALQGVAFGNGMFVAAGSNGTVIASRDGSEWFEIESNTDVHFERVRFGGGRFLLTGRQRANRFVFILEEEILRLGQEFAPGTGVVDLAWGKDYFVAFELGPGNVRISPDGEEWTRIETGHSHALRAIGFFEEKFVAVGGRHAVLESDDGLNWELKAGGPIDSLLVGVTYANDRFYAAGSDGGIWASDDAVVWRELARVDTGTGVLRPGKREVKRMAHGHGKFVLVGEEGLVLASEDGEIWEDHSLPEETRDFYHVNFGNGRFVAVGNGALILMSEDGENWVRGHSDYITITLRMSAFGNGVHVAGGSFTIALPFPDAMTAQNVDFDDFERRNVLISADGLDWEPVEGAPSSLVLAFGGGQFVGVGGTGAHIPVVRSADGVNWERGETPLGAGTVQDLLHANGRFFALHNAAVLRVSKDGVNWRSHRLPTQNQQLRRITYGRGKLVAVGATVAFCELDLELDKPAVNAEGEASLRLFGAIDRTGRIEYSDDLMEWHFLSDFSGEEEEPLTIRDPERAAQRFFRAVAE